jgi:hypothetical protein
LGWASRIYDVDLSTKYAMFLGKTIREMKKAAPCAAKSGRTSGRRSTEVAVFVFAFLGAVKVDVDVRPVSHVGPEGFGKDQEGQESAAADDDEG